MVAALIAGAVTALAILYAGIVTALVSEWLSSPDASYGIILAAIAAAVAWQRRRSFVDAARQNGGGVYGLLLLTTGLLLFLAGHLGADILLSRLSLVAVLAGVVWFLAGDRAMRVMAAPFAFFVIAIPLPALVVNTITLPLQLVASRIAEATLALAAVPVYRDGNVLMLPSTTLQVAEACSGLRSLVSLAAIGVVLAWANERSAWRRLAVLAITVPIAIVMNGLRLAATGIACETWGAQIASGGWHTFTGWLTFVGSVAILIGVARGTARAVSDPAPTVGRRLSGAVSAQGSRA